MYKDKLMNYSSKKIIYFLLVFILMIISSIPMNIHILLFDTEYDSEKLIYNISFLFSSFLLFLLFIFIQHKY